MTDYVGLLAIGDPHLASRTPGYRKDDYSRVVLKKLGEALAYARAERLLPALLGDVFHWPRDNANWLLVSALALFEQTEAIAIYGNHDCATNALEPDDSLQVLFQSGRLRLVTREQPWRGRMNGRPVVVGGTPWGCPLPDGWDEDVAEPPLVIWLTHHDLRVPGYDGAGRLLDPRPLPGIDLVINGHIHRPLGEVVTDWTTWVTPGNIARVARGESHAARVPSVLRVDVGADGLKRTAIPLTHAPYEDVFHPLPAGVQEEAELPAASDFVQGLAVLQANRTAKGEGLVEFLATNLADVEDAVAAEIRSLAEEVCKRG